MSWREPSEKGKKTGRGTNPKAKEHKLSQKKKGGEKEREFGRVREKWDRKTIKARNGALPLVLEELVLGSLSSMTWTETFLRLLFVGTENALRG